MYERGEGEDMDGTKKVGIVVAFIVLLALGLTAAPQIGAATVNVDCDKEGAIEPILSTLKPGDVVLVHGACQENILIQPELPRITVDGQRKATIKAADARQPVIQVLSREVTIKGFTVTGGFFGIAINRGATAVIDTNTIQHATGTGLEVSQNSFARIINNTIQHNGGNGIFVLGSASAHIGVLSTGDKISQPNVIQNNGGDGIQVLRSSTARIIGNTFSGNRRNGLTVQQASHADVAGNVFNGNGQHGIRVVGNSGVNLADSAMRLFEQPNTTTAPNGAFGIRCEVGALCGRTTGESQWAQWRQGHVGYELRRSLVSVTRQGAVAVAVQQARAHENWCGPCTVRGPSCTPNVPVRRT
jgi:parallel beta-helix repeat protein